MSALVFGVALAALVGCSAEDATPWSNPRARSQSPDASDADLRSGEIAESPDGSASPSIPVDVEPTPGAPPVDAGPGPRPVDAGPPALPGRAPIHPIYRAYNRTLGEHLYGVVKDEGSPQWLFESVAFYLFDNAEPGTTPLYRCRYGPAIYVHYLSLRADCEGGGLNEGIVGHIYESVRPNTQPLTRCYLAPNDHLVAVGNTSECLRYNFAIEIQYGYAPLP